MFVQDHTHTHTHTHTHRATHTLTHRRVSCAAANKKARQRGVARPGSNSWTGVVSGEGGLLEPGKQEDDQVTGSNSWTSVVEKNWEVRKEGRTFVIMRSNTQQHAPGLCPQTDQQERAVVLTRANWLRNRAEGVGTKPCLLCRSNGTTRTRFGVESRELVGKQGRGWAQSHVC